MRHSFAATCSHYLAELQYTVLCVMSVGTVPARPTEHHRSKPPVASQVPITSRWCKRALRPLTSIIVRLEKHWKATPLAETQKDGLPIIDGAVNDNLKPTRSSRRENRGRGLDDASDSESSPDDPTWVPGGLGRKQIKHRYSGRRQSGGTGRSRVVPRSPEAGKLRPGEFTVSTPLVLGKKRTIHDCDDVDSGPGVAGQAERCCPEQQVCQNPSKRASWPPDWEDRVAERDASDHYRDSGYIDIIHGIRRVWNTFLRVTADEPGATCGVRSLSSMALNKTSEYILHEQERLNHLDDKDEDVDVADAIITELERIYALSGRGWKPLMVLVRAHGIRLLCEAVRKKWISPLLSRQLVLDTADASFYDATESILSALLSTGPAITAPGRLDSSLFSLETHIGLNTLHVYTDRIGRRGFMFHELSALVSRGALPVEWMATEDAKTFVASAIQSISSDNEWSVHSAQFIAAVLSVSLGTKSVADEHSDFPESHRQAPKTQTNPSRTGRKTALSAMMSGHPNELTSHCDEFISTALSNTVCSITTVLTAAHLARFSHDTSFGADRDSPMHRIISLVSTIAQQEIESKWTPQSICHSRLQSLRTGQIFLADYILSCMGAGHDTAESSAAAVNEEEVFYPFGVVGDPFLGNFEYFLGLVSNRAELVSEFSSLVLQISRCWGRTHGEDGFSQMKRLTDVLISRSNATKFLPVLQAVLNKVAVDVALNFAELTCLRDHHVWALRVQDTVSTSGECDDLGTPCTPSLALSATGFRWEDGIGEWVARPPIVERRDKSRYSRLSAVVLRHCLSPSSRGSSRSSRDTAASSEDGSDGGGSGTPPSSVGDEERKNSDDSTVSEFESPWLSRKKRKSFPDRLFSGGTKHRKQTSSTLRYGPRRRRTVSGCDFYANGDHDNGCADSSSSSERLIPAGRDRRSSRVRVNKDIHRSPRPRRGYGGAEIEVRVPSIPTSAKKVQSDSSMTNFEIVVPQNDRHKYGVPGPKPDESPVGNSEDGGDDDIFISAPVLRDRIGHGQRTRPCYKAPSPDVHARRGSGNYPLRPRKPRGQGILGDEVPCSRESSEDELSFL